MFVLKITAVIPCATKVNVRLSSPQVWPYALGLVASLWPCPAPGAVRGAEGLREGSGVQTPVGVPGRWVRVVVTPSIRGSCSSLPEGNTQA